MQGAQGDGIFLVRGSIEDIVRRPRERAVVQSTETHTQTTPSTSDMPLFVL